MSAIPFAPPSTALLVFFFRSRWHIPHLFPCECTTIDKFYVRRKVELTEYENSNRIFRANHKFYIQSAREYAYTSMSRFSSLCSCAYVCALSLPSSETKFFTAYQKFGKNAVDKMTVIFQQNTQSFEALLRKKKKMCIFPLSFSFLFTTILYIYQALE